MLNSRSRVTVLLALALAGTTARAQEEEPERPTRLRAGPFRVAPVLELRDIGFDSNVYNVENKASDFTFIVIPTIVATSTGRRMPITIRSQTDLVFFARQQSERSVNEELNGSVQFRLPRVTLFADGGYLNTRQRPSEEIDTRSRRVAHIGQTGAIFTLRPKVALRMSGRYVRTIFDADAIFDNTLLARELNRTTRTLSASLRYNATPLTAFVVTGEIDDTRFTLAPIRDSDSEKLEGGVELAPRALIAGSVHVGVQRFRPRNAAMPSYEGFVGSAQVNYRLRGSTLIGFSFDRNLAYSYLDLEPYYMRQGFGGSVRHRLVERWDVASAVSRFRHQYLLVSAVPILDMISGEEFLDTGASVGYQARPGTSLRLGVSYRSRRSDVDVRSYTGLRLGTSIVYGF